MSNSHTFSPDYATARKRFRQAAATLGWQLEDHAIDAKGPAGEQLTLDVATSPGGDFGKTLVVSSGIHGVEGFFGSAVQLALLEKWASRSTPSLKCVLLHGLNPFGFAWLRRFDENNVDPNRNFLLPGERYEGAPAGYADLDRLLNPRRPPSRWEPFKLKAIFAIARQGMPALRQAVAAGQYEFPQGLFFGGKTSSQTHQLLEQNLARWLLGSQQVMHLDLHTGLGPNGTCKLLMDYPLNERQRTWLTDWFGADSFEACDANQIAYNVRGGFGRWCVSRNIVPDYLYACAEFGTYGPLQVLAGLRSENQAHHWGLPAAAYTIQTKQRLKELFCPSAEVWRALVLEESLDLVERAINGLQKI